MGKQLHKFYLVDADTFTAVGDKTAEFVADRKVRCDCGVDGYKYRVVYASTYWAPHTTVVLTADGDKLTGNLLFVDAVTWHGRGHTHGIGECIPLAVDVSGFDYAMQRMLACLDEAGKQAPPHCPYCGTVHIEGQTQCQPCGAPVLGLGPGYTYCPYCSRPNPVGAIACQGCGAHQGEA